MKALETEQGPIIPLHERYRLAIQSVIEGSSHKMCIVLGSTGSKESIAAGISEEEIEANVQRALKTLGLQAGDRIEEDGIVLPGSRWFPNSQPTMRTLPVSSKLTAESLAGRNVYLRRVSLEKLRPDTLFGEAQWTKNSVTWQIIDKDVPYPSQRGWSLAWDLIKQTFHSL